MRNRAKCKLCSSIIESFTINDYVSCECGEISIDGGATHLKVGAKNFENFLRLDEHDNEVPVKLVGDAPDCTEVAKEEYDQLDLSREKKVEIVDAMIKYYEKLPQHALLSSPTQYDLLAIYLMIKRIL